MKRLAVLLTVAAVALTGHASGQERQAFFGDLHVHTQNSFDAYIFNVRTTPDDAYNYAKGAPLKHAYGYPIRLRGAPLDFMGVTDHAMYMGVLKALGDPEHRLSRTEIASQLISDDIVQVMTAFRQVAAGVVTGEADPRLEHIDVIQDAWQEEVDAAERHNEPGKFTTFVAYEYTSSPPYNLHRNVVFKSARVPQKPFAVTDSRNPEDLWDWMDANRENGIESLAIPHNPNWSNGLMFQRTTFEGDPLSAAYAEQRMRNEPIVEMTQVKGTSDTHPLLSPNDEWAEFEIFADNDAALNISGADVGEIKINLKGSYVRDAYLAGLQMEETQGFNPYRFGLIGSSDTHNAGAPYEEQYFYSKTGVNDGLPVRRGSVPAEGVGDWESHAELPPDQKPQPYLAEWGASGLAGVWANENTRDAIYEALRRKETFATSGTRIRVRLFAGYGLDEIDHRAMDAVDGYYANGVPMGADLLARGRDTPTFVAWATRDPQSAWLQRLQIVKGWIEDGRSRERVFDVACSDGGTPDPETHRCPSNDARVNLSNCEPDFTKGDAELHAVWQDPDFDPAERAFYYVRVLENPTCRWSTWDALRAGIAPNPTMPVTLQERAWSSPIWVLPAS